MERLSLTTPNTAAATCPSWAPAASALVAIGGAVLALGLTAIWPLAISLAGALACGWLMHTQPLEREVEYFSADEDGLRYVQVPGQDGQDGQVTRYKWTEILEVRAIEGGLSVQTGRGTLKGAAVFLPMHSAADSQAASAAAGQWLTAYRL
ncbi:hypothetical protein GTP56_13340 [Duganella sp. FT134W]|uniref:Uncharacterized protein n=1 Tax=Duganella margarita TaxID=2692170 RepID=A0A7X4H225_9BURK|nr:hypothetical protein [Duganella margarita]MYM73174.1 hypothetical protein [Duganella margarita]